MYQNTQKNFLMLKMELKLYIENQKTKIVQTEKIIWIKNI